MAEAGYGLAEVKGRCRSRFGVREVEPFDHPGDAWGLAVSGAPRMGGPGPSPFRHRSFSRRLPRRAPEPKGLVPSREGED